MTGQWSTGLALRLGASLVPLAPWGVLAVLRYPQPAPARPGRLLAASWICLCCLPHTDPMFLVRTAKPCSSSRPCHWSSTATARRVKDARLGTAQRRKASLMRLDGDGHA